MKNKTVLYVDDDQTLQVVVGDYLATQGVKVISALDAKQALEKSNSAIDIVLLDLVLPDAEGTSLIMDIQSKTGAGIIVVSGKNDTMEKIVCLEMGADDYITKPFEMRELSARIKAVIRRSKNHSANNNNATSELESLKLPNGWNLDRKQYQLFDDKDSSVNLTTGEFQLLEALMLAPNRALSREQLFDLTRDGNFDAYDRAIDIQVARLRKKIGDDTKNPNIIKTVRGVGYMYVA